MSTLHTVNDPYTAYTPHRDQGEARQEYLTTRNLGIELRLVVIRSHKWHCYKSYFTWLWLASGGPHVRWICLHALKQSPDFLWQRTHETVHTDYPSNQPDSHSTPESRLPEDTLSLQIISSKGRSEQNPLITAGLSSWWAVLLQYSVSLRQQVCRKTKRKRTSR